MHHPRSRFRSLYGAGPVHLLTVLAALAFAGAILTVVGLSSLWDPEVWWQSIAVWFLGAVLLHDLLLFPLYAGVDVAIRRGTTGRARAPAGTRVAAVNHIRVPLLAIGLSFLLFFPGILQQGKGSFARATGQTQDPFLERWLVLSAAILAASAIVYAGRLLHSRLHRSRDDDRHSTDRDDLVP